MTTGVFGIASFVYIASYAVLRDATITDYAAHFGYPGAQRLYAISEDAIDDFDDLTSIDNLRSVADGVYSADSDDTGERWVFTPTDEPATWKSAYRVFGPLERMEMWMRGRSPLVVTNAMLAARRASRSQDGRGETLDPGALIQSLGEGIGDE